LFLMWPFDEARTDKFNKICFKILRDIRLFLLFTLVPYIDANVLNTLLYHFLTGNCNLMYENLIKSSWEGNISWKYIGLGLDIKAVF